MRGGPSRQPVDDVPDKEFPSDVPDARDRVSKALDGENMEINTSTQEVTWGELKSNN